MFFRMRIKLCISLNIYTLLSNNQFKKLEFIIIYGRKICTTIEENVTLTGRHGRCMILYVQIVVRKLKFRLNQMGAGPFIVGSVIKNIDPEDFSIRI